MTGVYQGWVCHWRDRVLVGVRPDGREVSIGEVLVRSSGPRWEVLHPTTGRVLAQGDVPTLAAARSRAAQTVLDGGGGFAAPEPPRLGAPSSARARYWPPGCPPAADGASRPEPSPPACAEEPSTEGPGARPVASAGVVPASPPSLGRSGATDQVGGPAAARAAPGPGVTAQPAEPSAEGRAGEGASPGASAAQAASRTREPEAPGAPAQPAPDPARDAAGPEPAPAGDVATGSDPQRREPGGINGTLWDRCLRQLEQIAELREEVEGCSRELADLYLFDRLLTAAGVDEDWPRAVRIGVLLERLRAAGRTG